MHLGFLRDVFAEHRHDDALVWNEQTYTYEWLLGALDRASAELEAAALDHGSVVSVEADFSPNAVALFLALLRHGCVLVPLTSSVANQRDEFLEIAEVEAVFDTARDAQLAGEKLFEDRLFSVQQVSDNSLDLGWFSHAVP